MHQIVLYQLWSVVSQQKTPFCKTGKGGRTATFVISKLEAIFSAFMAENSFFSALILFIRVRFILF